LDLKEKVTEGWGKIHNGELHDNALHLKFVRAIKSRRMRSMRHVACTIDMRTEYSLENLKGRDYM
jgi:hypothetical protein